MKKILLILFILVLSLVLVAQHNNSPRVIISRVFKDNPTYSGFLKYKVYFLGFIPMGEAKLSPPEIEEYQGQKVYHLHGAADSFASYSKFYRAHAEIDSYLDLKKLNPLLFKQRLVIAGKTDNLDYLSFHLRNALPKWHPMYYAEYPKKK